MTSTRMLSAALAVMTLLAGCSSGGGSKAPATSSSTQPSSPTTSTTSAAPTTSAAAMSLREACPKLEAAMPADDLTATAADWTATLALVQTIRANADTEAQNAIDLLTPGLEAQAGGEVPAIDAMQTLLTGIQAVANRCKLAGSSAFQ